MTTPDYLSPTVAPRDYRHVQPLPPALAKRPGIGNAIGEHARLLAIFRDARSAHQAVASLTAQDAAREADRVANERAVRDGADDPGTPAMDALENEAKATYRRASGARDALASAYEAVFALLRGRAAEDWLDAIATERAAARETLTTTATLAAVFDTVDTIDRADAEEEWARKAIAHARGEASMPPSGVPHVRRRALFGRYSPEDVVSALKDYGRDSGPDPMAALAQGPSGAPLGAA